MDQTQDVFFQLKADFVPLTVIKITNPTIKGIQQQLTATIEKAPNYFQRAPVIIDVADIKQQDTLNLLELTTALKSHQIIPVAIRGLADNRGKEASEQGLAILKGTTEKEKQPEKSSPAASTKPKNASPTKIITKPIRAGSQVYAKGGDLIILAGVNHGAECFADGSIHVYGPLRGRALAGVSGDTNARIFCKSLEAELVAIAGHYKVNENISAPNQSEGMTQIYLNNNQLEINTI